MDCLSTPRPALVIGGPTASGKTAIAFQIAQKIGGEVINADAFQLYEGLPLLTAQPTDDEFAKAPHQLFSEIDLAEEMDAARYRSLALQRISQSLERGLRPILVGGTGMYLKAVLYGLSEGLPAPSPALRETLECRSLDDLTRELISLDPDTLKGVDLRNPRRVVRALEVCLLTNRPFTSFRNHQPWQGHCAGIWLSLPRESLHQRIEERATRLFDQGVEEEVRKALPRLGPTSRQAIGVQAVTDVLEGRLSRKDAEQRICAATRQYARRQETWFRKEAALQCVPGDQAMGAALRLLDTL